MEWLSGEHWSIVVGVLDVLVVSFLIYRILLMLKGTRALHMLFGLGVVVVVYLLARQSGLSVLHWLLDNFLESVILVIVVVFQDDIRRALLKVGLGPGLVSPLGSNTERVLREIARASSELASRRLGALMVISRDVGLTEYSEDAVALGAEVSHQLLISLFLPTSPLHDGATIISGERISVAGAVLPLSFNPNIKASLGTRHRAALGLSERTDALIVVVSEETGTISLVREGRMTRDLNEKSLYNALHRLIVVREEKRKRGPQSKSQKKSPGDAAADTTKAQASPSEPASPGRGKKQEAHSSEGSGK